MYVLLKVREHRILILQNGCSNIFVTATSLGKKTQDQRVPHDLALEQTKIRVDSSQQLVNVRRNFDSLNNLVTRDEKWFLHVNLKHDLKRTFSIQRPMSSTPAVFMICLDVEFYANLFNNTSFNFVTPP